VLRRPHPRKMVETSSLNDTVADDCINKRARGTGKLSSRNTRRKRREQNKLSAKKLKPPIPSFSCSPIIEEEDDDEVVENEPSASLDSLQRDANEAKHSKKAATSQTGVKITKQPEINNRVSHESESIIVDTADGSKLLRPLAANGYLLQQDNVRSVSTSSADGLNDSIGDKIDDCGKSTNTAQEAVNDAPPPPTSAAEMISQKASKHTNKLSPSAPAITSTQKTEEQPRKNNVCNNTKSSQRVYDMVEVAKPELQSTKFNTTKTIEIFDDDYEQAGNKDLPLVTRTNSVNVGIEEKVPDKPNIQSRKRKRSEKMDPISVDSSSDEESMIEPKRTKSIAQKKKKPARRKPAATKSKLESNDTADESASGTQKSTRKKLCTACASCKCQSRDGSATSPQKLSSLSLHGSDARVEQTLKNRMLKIERNIAWSTSQRHQCARELKRHRSTLQKKFSKTEANTDKRQHFLADAQVTEEMAQAFATARVDRKEVKQIQTRVFGKRASLSKKEPQPTLTQMFGGGGTERNEDRSDDDLSANEDDQSGDISSAEESCRADHHDSLSFWNSESIHATDQFFGSMTQFDEAATRFKDKQAHSIAAWAMATAKRIRNEAVSQSCEEEEGIDALVDLFDLSPTKKLESMSSHVEECDASFLKSQLSQSGERAAQSITEEIAKDECKRVAIERACPHWKENVEYSFRRKDSDGLEDALYQVKKEKQRLEEARDRILQAFLERSSTLEVYEKAIEGSLRRLAEKENDNA